MIKGINTSARNFAFFFLVQNLTAMERSNMGNKHSSEEDTIQGRIKQANDFTVTIDRKIKFAIELGILIWIFQLPTTPDPISKS